MAIDITVTESYINVDHFEGRTTPVYVFSGSGGSGSGGMSWYGSTPNAIGTYGDANTIIAEEFLTYYNGYLFVGNRTTVYEPSTYVFAIGSTTATEYGGIELVGNQTVTGQRIGSFTFHNAAASQSDKLVVDVFSTRDGSDNSADFNLDIATTAGVMEHSYHAGRDIQKWWTDGTQRLELDLTSFSPYSNGTFNLGASTSHWGDIYGTDLFAGVSVNTPYGSATNTIMAGSTTLTEYGGIEIVGNQTSNLRLGGVSIHNTQATPADKKVVDLYGTRNSDNDTATFRIDIAAPAGTGMDYAYLAADDQHSWWISGTLELNLTATELAPQTDAGLDLGTSSLAFGTGYMDNVRVNDLGGSGNQSVFVDNDGDLYADDAAASYNFTNGLTEESNLDVKVGGSITSDTYLTMAATQTFELRANFGGKSAKLGIYGSGSAYQQSYNAADYSNASGFSQITATPTKASMLYNISGGGGSFEITSSAMTVLDGNSKGLYYAGDYSTGATDRWIPDKAYVDSTTGDYSVSEEISYTTCPDNATTYITIGENTDVTFQIHYIAERNMGTVQKQAGNILVLYDDVTNTADLFYTSVGPMLDFTIDVAVVGIYIQFNIIVGNDNTNDLSFDYRIISKFYE